uniref:Uncharacterized protein n=1 Tax=Romanomermis culicivorax TaxID=13658 RepID=A0A915JIW8_ROMCU
MYTGCVRKINPTKFFGPFCNTIYRNAVFVVCVRPVYYIFPRGRSNMNSFVFVVSNRRRVLARTTVILNDNDDYYGDNDKSGRRERTIAIFSLNTGRRFRFIFDGLIIVSTGDGLAFRRVVKHGRTCIIVS